MGPIGFCNELHDGSAQMSHGTVDDDEDAEAPDWMLDGLCIFSRRLHIMCVMVYGASFRSLVPWLEPAAADVDVDGKLDANDCVRFANDVIPRRERYVIRTKYLQSLWENC